ncbi:hypothetical protein SAMN05216168_4540 [Kosakonia radicincitans]|uniref:hypothetical protein n=1 Tax=Kosakonia radicincitans TaxID=283686 RepID=UPI0009A83B49|nr:hypothetical protein [Kosakonia radicincitans]SKC22505.1 hypothetical protein SAMN05216168_4540 [Kosakonia radicincitans]
MFNYEELMKSAPDFPTFEAKWAPVYFEPIMGSGERFTIIIAAYSKNGTYRVCNAIRPHVVKAMYGEKHNHFNELIEIIIRSLESYLKEKNTFEGWVSPFIGAELGNINSAQSSDMTGVLRQAIQLTASLSSLDFFATEEENDDKYSSENTWANQFKELVVYQQSSLEQYFNREFKVDGLARPSKIFYLSPKIAVNTDRLIPTNLANHLDRNKARILDLLAVKDHDIFERNRFEFIVYRPQADEPIYSKSQFIKLAEALHALEEIGDKHSIRVIPVTTVNQAAIRLIQAEQQVA